jgi:hypothetical protein
MGNPFLFADRFSGAVVHLTTDYIERTRGRLPAGVASTTTTELQKRKMPATA